MLKRMKPSRWIAFLMFSWGAITMGLGGVQNFASVAVVRFLLGVFEAGEFGNASVRLIRVDANDNTISGLFPGLVCKPCQHHDESLSYISDHSQTT